jgi:hypothetical protein
MGIRGIFATCILFHTLKVKERPAFPLRAFFFNKSCLKTDFAVNDELTVLIGPNGSGKKYINRNIRH